MTAPQPSDRARSLPGDLAYHVGHSRERLARMLAWRIWATLIVAPLVWLVVFAMATYAEDLIARAAITALVVGVLLFLVWLPILLGLVGLFFSKLTRRS